MSDRTDKFIQPVSAITVVKRSLTSLTDEELLKVKARIAAGEDADAVYAELAQMELEREAE